MNKTKKSRILTLSITGASILAIAGGLTIAANMNGDNLDLLLGRGKQVTDDTGEGLDTDYIDYEYDSQADALKNAQDITRKTAEEGMTLLKNDDGALPLSKTAKITILGYYAWHNNMSGGEDPATTNGAVSLGKGLENGFDTNAAVNAIYGAAHGELADPSTDLAAASSSFSSYDTAVVVIKRNSGEGNDQSLDSGAGEFHRTGLSLNNSELELLDFANKNFNKVVVVVNAANSMELGFLDKEDPNYASEKWKDPYSEKTIDVSKTKAAIWAGCCGSQGGTALAKILNGEVNPSGHLVDTYARSLRNDPSYKNFGSYLYTNSASLNSYQQETYFVEYEEGIYVGYRYYETAAYEAGKGNYSGFDYDTSVVYPFGYGLSYTTFGEEYTGTPTYDEKTGNYSFNVKVTNTGSVAGKGVAQIYVNVPYVSGGVEKAHVVLGGYGKTQELSPNQSETLTITVNQDYFTSYDYKDEKAYILDKGDYNFYLSDNAHSWDGIDKMGTSEKAKYLWTTALGKKYVFKDGADGKRLTDKSQAINKEDDELNYKFKDYDEGAAGDGYAHDFTRRSFKASFPTSPVGNDFVLSDSRAKKQVGIYDVWAKENNPVEKMPETDTDDTSYTLADMRGVDWDDPKWDDYMNQFAVDSMANMFMNGGWNELADEDNGVPLSYDCDSPYGYYGHALTIKDINKWYCGDPMVAATFNDSLAKEIGNAFGEEAHANYLAGGTLITGLYGYGANTHRSAFGGRNYEYYSEDPLLSGKMASAEASGASEKGLITFMKHYVLNEQETNRQKNGYCAWVNEQAFREIYVKPWEIYIKEAKMKVNYYGTDENGQYVMKSKEMPAATGIMTSYNRVGANWAGASVSINGILRDEFGYHGNTITDAGGQPNTYMTTDYMLRRGGTLTLTNNGTNGLYDTESPTAVSCLKDAAKHILYNKANSNIMVGMEPGVSFHYETSPWRLAVNYTWIGLGILGAADLTFIILICLDIIKVKEKAAKVKVGDEVDEF